MNATGCMPAPDFTGRVVQILLTVLDDISDLGGWWPMTLNQVTVLALVGTAFLKMLKEKSNVPSQFHEQCLGARGFYHKLVVPSACSFTRAPVPLLAWAEHSATARPADLNRVECREASPASSHSRPPPSRRARLGVTKQWCVLSVRHTGSQRKGVPAF